MEFFADGVACHECWNKTTIFSGKERICYKCGKLFSGQGSDYYQKCGRCEDDFYDCARAAGIYIFALKASILELKERDYVYKRLRNIILNGFEQSGFTNVDLLIPVPLSQQRLRERGFNQSKCIAELISKHFSIPLNEGILKRSKHSIVHRASMDRRGRQLSVRAAFDTTGSQPISGKRIALVDDVFTTGATASVCAKTLKKAGAKEVLVFTIARGS